MELAASVADEIKELRESFPKLKIQTSTSSFLIASYERTPSTRIKFTITFPPGYPDHSLIIDIKADEVVPPGLKKKLEHDLVVDIPLGLHQQVITVVNRLVQFINHNKFLPCWKELKQCLTLVMNDKSDDDDSTISIIEAKGKIKLKLCRGKYFYNCSIVIDEGYPTTMTHEDWGKPCVLTLTSTNFPPKIETMLTSQAREVVRRMQDGMTSEQAHLMSNPIPQPKMMDDDSKKKDVTVRITKESLKGIKHDVETLSRVRDLREVNATRVQGKAHVLASHAKERKAARKEIHKITGHERAADEDQWQQDEKARLAGYGIPDHDGSTNPQPSLLALVTFLKEKIQHLPEAKCPCCQTLALPSDPNKLKALYVASSECKTDKEKKERKLARALRPIRCYCGCWYHFQCLDKFMTEPPFGIACPTEGCGRRVFHPDWPADISQLEREWASHQARLREIQDAAMFL